MAHLTCITHGKRVVVVASDDNQTATVFHRNVTGNESARCDSFHVVIDGDVYPHSAILNWGTVDYADEECVDAHLQSKYDKLIYA